MADQPELLRRVRIGRMSVAFALCERAKTEAGRGAGGDAAMLALGRQRFEPFMQTRSASGLTRLREGQEMKFKAYRDELGKPLGPKK